MTCTRRPTEWVSIFGFAATQWSSLNLARGRQPLYSTSFTGRTTVSKLTCLNLCEGGQHLSCHCGREKRGDYRGFWLPARVRKWTRLHKPPTLGSSQWFTPSTRNDGVPLDHRFKRIALFRPLAGSAPQSVRRQIGSPRLASQLLSAWLTTMKSMIGTGVYLMRLGLMYLNGGLAATAAQPVAAPVVAAKSRSPRAAAASPASRHTDRKAEEIGLTGLEVLAGLSPGFFAGPPA